MPSAPKRLCSTTSFAGMIRMSAITVSILGLACLIVRCTSAPATRLQAEGLISVSTAASARQIVAHNPLQLQQSHASSHTAWLFTAAKWPSLIGHAVVQGLRTSFGTSSSRSSKPAGCRTLQKSKQSSLHVQHTDSTTGQQAAALPSSYPAPRPRPGPHDWQPGTNLQPTAS